MQEKVVAAETAAKLVRCLWNGDDNISIVNE